METKLKFKVGDKVRVKSQEWYNNNKDVNDLVYIDEEGIVFDKTMAKYCGKIVQIEEVNKTGYFVNGALGFFEDWMLEDGVITEEKQEVEQLNKKVIETKKMTKQDVFSFLKNTKVMCTSEEQAINVQKKLFDLGVSFFAGRAVKEALLLFIDEKLELTYCTSFSCYVKDNSKQIEASEILAIVIEEPKPKFDPKTLQPFDKVLVRDDENEEWSCNLYSHLITSENRYRYKCIYDPYVMCIPYNDETKHLVGTADEAPEFYR